MNNQTRRSKSNAFNKILSYLLFDLMSRTLSVNERSGSGI